MRLTKKQREEVPDFRSFFAQLASCRRVLITRDGIAERAGNYFEFYRIKGYTPQNYFDLSEQLSRSLSEAFATRSNPNVSELYLVRNVPLPRKIRDFKYRHRVRSYVSREEWAVKHGLAVVLTGKTNVNLDKKE
jgi:hypothetical protein